MIPFIICAGPGQLSGACDQIRTSDFCSRDSIACWSVLIALPCENTSCRRDSVLVTGRYWKDMEGVTFCCRWWQWRLRHVVHCGSPLCCDLLHVTDSLGKIAMVCYGILIGSCCVDGDASRDGCRCCLAVCYRVLLLSRVSCVSYVLAASCLLAHLWFVANWSFEISVPLCCSCCRASGVTADCMLLFGVYALLEKVVGTSCDFSTGRAGWVFAEMSES